MARGIGEEQDEGQTPIEDLSGLIPRIHLQKELNLCEYKNYVKAVTKYRLMPLESKEPLFTYEGLIQIHRDMMGDVWEWAGEPRKTNKSIGVPKEKIGSELHKLLYELRDWEKSKKSAEEIGVQLHHGLVWIHPFENGNGRWARLITNIYLRHSKSKPVKWPDDPEYVKNVFRPRYLKAMKAADGGDFKLLGELHREYEQND